MVLSQTDDSDGPSKLMVDEVGQNFCVLNTVTIFLTAAENTRDDGLSKFARVAHFPCDLPSGLSGEN